MPKFRKKPVEIEARRFDFDDVCMRDVVRWCGGELRTFIVDDPYIIIHTLEGDHKATLGDWIICGVKGEFYPCKPDIFEATYEPV